MLSGARHIIGEHQRVLQVRGLLRPQEPERLGKLLIAAHGVERFV